MTEVNRRCRTAQRELRKAVERFATVTDPLPGHRIEAVRQARAVRDAANDLVEEMEKARR